MNNNSSSIPENPDNESDPKKFAEAFDTKMLLHCLLATDYDCIYFKDRKGRFIKVSPAHAKLFGLDNPDDVIGKTDFDFFDKENASRFFNGEKEIITTGHAMRNVEEMDTFPDGTVTWFSTTKVAMYDSTGTAVGIVGISRDITERKLQERHVQQVTRLYAAMSQTYQAMLRARTREDLFSEVCRALVDSAHFDMAWIGLVSPGNPTVEPTAKFGDNLDYLRRIQIFYDERLEGCGPVGTAIRTGSTQVVNNFQDNPTTEPWHADARQSGWNSCTSVPIRIAGQVAGALSVYSKSPGYFSDKEVILLERASADISSALEMIDALAAMRP